MIFLSSVRFVAIYLPLVLEFQGSKGISQGLKGVALGFSKRCLKMFKKHPILLSMVKIESLRSCHAQAVMT